MLTEKIKKIIYILLLSLLIYIIFLIIPKFSNIISFIFKVINPFLISFVLAFLLQPFVCKLQKYVKKRGIAVAIVLFISSILIVIFVKYIANVLIYEFEHLSNKFPDIINELEDIINKIFDQIPFLKKYDISLEDLINNNSNLITDTIIYQIF